MDAMYQHERRILDGLKAQGYSPKIVYDIGASTGIWTEVISTVLPEAEYYLFEPLAETLEIYKRDLQPRLHRLPRARLFPVALGDTSGYAEMFVAVDGYGSSLNDRGDIPEVTGTVTVPKFRLDDL